MSFGKQAAGAGESASDFRESEVPAGKFASEGLQAINEEDDILMAMARELDNGEMNWREGGLRLGDAAKETGRSVCDKIIRDGRNRASVCLGY